MKLTLQKPIYIKLLKEQEREFSKLTIKCNLDVNRFDS